MLKTCSRCNLEKPVSEMGVDKRSSTGVGVWCVSCHKAYTREYWIRNRAKVTEKLRQHRRVRHDELAALKDKPCMDCNRKFPSEAMDFDHVSDDKVKGVGRMTTHHPNALLAEVAKCELVCANCHRLRTKNRLTPPEPNPTKTARRWLLFSEKLQTLKSDPCVDCGLTFSPCIMEFDHVRGLKVRGVSAMSTYPWPKVLAEVAKCELVCACCHRTRTAIRRIIGGV